MYRLIPFLGAFFESGVKPNLYAAHLMEMWLEMRSRMAGDKKDKKSGERYHNSSLLEDTRFPSVVAYDSGFWRYVMSDREEFLHRPSGSRKV